MKKPLHTFYLPVSLVVLACLCTLTARNAQAADSTVTPQEQEHEDDPLAKAMEDIEDHIRALRRSIRDEAQNEASLASIVGMQAAVALAKVELPPMAATLEGEKRSEFVRAYRHELIEMGRKLLDLEDLVLNSKMVDAQAMFKEIRALEDSGHERFTEDG